RGGEEPESPRPAAPPAPATVPPGPPRSERAAGPLPGAPPNLPTDGGRRRAATVGPSLSVPRSDDPPVPANHPAPAETGSVPAAAFPSEQPDEQLLPAVVLRAHAPEPPAKPQLRPAVPLLPVARAPSPPEPEARPTSVPPSAGPPLPRLRPVAKN